MRNLAAALAASLLALAIAVPAASPALAAAPPQPKVVIIVGPVGSSTSYYKSDGDAAYAEARKYTTNVVKVYTPKATWAAAKAAMQGASIVIYMGHGNGFPSPYRSTPWAYSENGLGLNATAGTDNTAVQYYGEYYLARDVKLAPNAVVILSHLCYASGNSESEYPAPTRAVAKQRVDNMAAGWLKTGARAVIAEGHFGPAWYVRQLFTTHQTIDQIWHASPTYNDNAFTFLSTRTPGATAEMDPDGSPNGYWRALTGWLGTSTDDITGAAYAATNVDPTSFVVPGAASVNVDTAGVYPDASLTPDSGTGMPAVTLARDTRLRLLAAAGTDATGAPIFQVATLDGATTGWMSGADLIPRDSAGPAIWTVSDGDGAFSPNGDGSGDTITLTARISEPSSWTARFEDGSGHVLATTTGSTDTINASWNGIVGGHRVADGTYRYELSAADGWGNPVATKSGTLVVDTVAPAFTTPVTSSLDSAAVVPTISPAGAGSASSIAFGFATSEPGYVDVTVRAAGGSVVRSFPVAAGSGPGSASWDGTNDLGSVVADGTYAVSIAPRDYAGNIGPARVESVAVYDGLAKVTASTSIFFPQDLDAYGKTTKLSFTLATPATVTWTVKNAAGIVVLTRYDAVALAAGTYAFNWNGRSTDGTMLPRGTYTSWVTATDGALSATGHVSVLSDAFRIGSSDKTPGRGQKITITVTSAEALPKNPRLTIHEPGVTSWSVTLVKTGTYTYKATITLKKGHPAGTVTFTVRGVDKGKKANQTTVALPLH